MRPLGRVRDCDEPGDWRRGDADRACRRREIRDHPAACPRGACSHTQAAAAAHEKVRELDHQIHAWHRLNELRRRLETIPGIGPITVSAIVATATDASPVQIRPATRGLAWPRAATELVLRKGSDRPDQQAGRSLYPSTACSWRACRPRCQSSADRKREFPRTFCH
jgi:transposase